MAGEGWLNTICEPSSGGLLSDEASTEDCEFDVVVLGRRDLVFRGGRGAEDDAGEANSSLVTLFRSFSRKRE